MKASNTAPAYKGGIYNLQRFFILLALLALCLLGLLAAAMLFARPRWLFVLLLLGAFLCLGTLSVFFIRLNRSLLHLESTVTQLWATSGRKPVTQQNTRSLTERVSTASSELEALLVEYISAVDRQYQEEILYRQMQFSALQSQINPHFLYNILESIRGIALCRGVTEIADMTEALSLYFRYSINQKGNFVTLAEELGSIKNYFRIQHYRFGDRFRLVIDTEQAEGLEEFLIPKLTLQPLVENSIYHGLEPKVGNGTVRITLITTRKHLIIRVADDGIGMSKERVEQIRQGLTQEADAARRAGGIALRNVHQRIQIFFGGEYGLHIESSPDLGTEVELFMPTTTDVPTGSVRAKEG